MAPRQLPIHVNHYSLTVKSLVVTAPMGSPDATPRKTHQIFGSSVCRESLIGRLFYSLKRATAKNQYSTPIREIILDDKRNHQPGVTRLSMGRPSYPRGEQAEKLIHTTDAITSLVCLALNPDWYCGNWWSTSVEELTENFSKFTWYGTDNFFLAHPALTSLVLGLFRQSVLLNAYGHSGNILRAAPRKEVESALSNSDPEKALYLIKKLKPFLVSRLKSNQYPIRGPQFELLPKLHKAIYTHGLTKVFGKPSKAWKLTNPYLYSANMSNSGFYSYFGVYKPTAKAQKIEELVAAG